MEIVWSDVIGELITAILKIIVPVLVALVLKWACDLWVKIKESHPDVAYFLEMAAQIGFSAAEEYFRNDKVSGEQKLEYAIKHAEKYLLENGVKVDLGVVKDAIIAYGVEHQLFGWQNKTVPEVKNGSNKPNGDRVG